MSATPIEASAECVEQFQTCVEDYRAAVREIRRIEERMTECVAAMQAQGARRERLLAASTMVGEVRTMLSQSRTPSEAARRGRLRAA